MVSESIHVEDRADGVRVVRLDRPDRLNALTRAMVASIAEAMTVDSDRRAIVVTGAGRAFCAGVDIAEAQQRHESGRPIQAAFALQEEFSAMAIAVHHSPVPVIAAINGPVAGAGFALALSCDIRIATESARFIPGAPTIGLSAAESGISYFLPRLIGMGRAHEIMLTNRQVEAEEALRIGLVTSLHADQDALASCADEITGRIARLSPFGVKMTKEVARQTVDSPHLQHAINLENRTQVMATFTQDANEARTAFIKKRTPHYTGT